MNQLELFLTRKVHTTILSPSRLSFFFFNDTATTEIYTLSLHDALPIRPWPATGVRMLRCHDQPPHVPARSEEHTSELQSPVHLVCRLLLEKKKKTSENSPQRRTGPRSSLQPCMLPPLTSYSTITNTDNL